MDARGPSISEAEFLGLGVKIDETIAGIPASIHRREPPKESLPKKRRRTSSYIWISSYKWPLAAYHSNHLVQRSLLFVSISETRNLDAHGTNTTKAD